MEKKKSTGKSALNPVKFVKLCFQSWKVFVVSVIICVGLVGVYAIWRTPVSTVEAQLMLKDDPGAGGSMMLGDIAKSFSLGDMFGGSSTTDNEAGIMRSHSVFLKTAKELGLNKTYMYPRFGFKWVPMPLTSPISMSAPENISDTISCGLQFNVERSSKGKYDINCKHKRSVIAKVEDVSLPYSFKTPYGVFTFNLTPYAAMPESKNIERVRILYSSYAAAAESYAQLVDIYVPDRKTDFIGMSFKAVDPKFGIMVLDSLIANYTDVGNDYKIERAKQSLRLVNERIATLAEEISESEEDMERFKKANKLTDVEIDAQYLMGKSGEIEGGLLKAQTNYEVAKLTRDFINDPQNNYALIPDLFTSAGVTAPEGATQISAYNQLILTRMELLRSAKANSTPIKQIDEQIDAMRDNIITTINRMYENSRVQLKDLKDENIKTKDRIGELPTLERKYINLKRDNLLQNQMYLFLLQQREELNMSLASRSLPAQIIDAPHALVDNGTLSKLKLLVIGVFFGLLLGAAYVFLIKMPKSKVGTKDEFDGINRLPEAGALQRAAKADTPIALDNANRNAEAFRFLRSEVQQALKSCDGKVVMVTSLHPAEGKTYTAVNLACALAKLGKNVVIVDAALRHPSVAEIFDIHNPTAAVAEYVLSRGSAGPDIANVAVDSRDTLDVVTAAEHSANASDILGSDDMKHLVSGFSDKYDYVVIDSGSINGYSDAAYLTEISDVTLVVCRKGFVTIPDLDVLNGYLDNGTYKRMIVVTNEF